MKRAISILLPCTLLLSACSREDKAVENSAQLPSEAELSTQVATSTDKKLSFNEDIQPVLSEYCYHCHGPDSSSRKPKGESLRLDRGEYALATRKNGIASIIPGDAENSEVYKRLITHDADELMPPAEAHKVMKPEEIELIKDWINQGAEYEEHWAFIPPTKSETPELQSHQTWVKHETDYFVAAKLEELGLQAAEQQNGSRLFRRLSFDLTGLPPTPEELKQFLEESSVDFEKAYQDAITRMFSSDAYAENMSRHWLDAVRYGDTHGIHNDNLRSIWPYRDWVIKAFQENKPFDEFTIEQIAGDLLPDAQLDQMIATGYNRCIPTTGEGGAIPEEYLSIYAQDRVDTTFAIWQGLTTGCAACHDHKFDPLSTKENYELTAFFRNSTMSALDGNNENHPPFIFVPQEEDLPAWTETSKQLKSVLKEKKEMLQAAIKEGSYTQEGSIQIPENMNDQLAVHIPFSQVNKDSFKALVDGENITIAHKHELRDGLLGDTLNANQPREGKHATIPLGEDYAQIPMDGHFSYGLWILPESIISNDPIISRFDYRKTNGKTTDKGWDIWLAGGAPTTHLSSGDQKERMTKVTSKEALHLNEWNHVFFTYDGKDKENPVRIFLNGIETPVEYLQKNLDGDLTTEAPLVVGERFGGDSLEPEDGKVMLNDFRLYTRTLSPEEVYKVYQVGLIPELRKQPVEGLNEIQKEAYSTAYLSQQNTSFTEIVTQELKLKKTLLGYNLKGVPTLVMDERKTQKPSAHVLIRGVYSELGEKVEPGVPEILGAMQKDAPKSRLGLAEWLVSGDNPLTSRVTVNRYWYYLFGQGIVETTEDFGIMGGRPSHPQLLDWLAVDFEESGWDLQHLLRTIVSTATYRQEAIITKEKKELDPNNLYFSRGPRYRLDAEQIRDLALVSADILNPKVGGAPVKPYQPEGVWEAVAMPSSNTAKYKQDTGDKLYRRSIYTFLKRTAPPANMEILNAPTREIFCVRRERTNTPLQAFVTMNDIQFIESARVLASKALTDQSDLDSQLDFISTRILSRLFDQQERDILKASYQLQLDNYQANPEEAQQLISYGEIDTDTSLDPAQLASLTMVCSQIFNLDETINK